MLKQYSYFLQFGAQKWPPHHVGGNKQFFIFYFVSKAKMQNLHGFINVQVLLFFFILIREFLIKLFQVIVI